MQLFFHCLFFGSVPNVTELHILMPWNSLLFSAELMPPLTVKIPPKVTSLQSHLSQLKRAEFKITHEACS